MHIVSYMGYLLGKNEGKGIEIVIISKDKDYDNLITFWKDKAKISRKQKIDINSQKTTTKAQQPKETKKTQKTTTQSKQKTKKLTKSELKVKLNAEIQKAMATNNYDTDSINSVAKLVVKAYGKESFLQDVHNKIAKTYKDHAEIYKIVKPIITKYNKLQ